MSASKLDVDVSNEGSIFLVTPCTQAARDWIEENVGGETQWFGKALVVEHRYIQDLVIGMQHAGLTVA